MGKKAVRVGSLLCSAPLILMAQRNTGHNDEQAIRQVIHERETAWNAGDVMAYGRLLTEDADLLSATGRPVAGRKAILDLYLEQRARAYAGLQTTTPVESIRFVSPDVAIVDTRFQLTGVRAKDGSPLGIRRGLLTLVVVKRENHWLITCMRGIPESPIR